MLCFSVTLQYFRDYTSYVIKICEIMCDISESVLHLNFRGYTEFPSVDKTKNKQITDIYLKGNKIRTLPKDLNRLGSLESLYLSCNDIRILPREIGLLNTLKCLDLRGNLLRKLPEEIENLKNLRYLFLDDNKVSELPLVINRLNLLRYFSICDNELSWLAQKPVYNIYACDFRFWTNKFLNYLPYTVWLTMFSNQVIRCINIGLDCCNINTLCKSHNNIINVRHDFPSKNRHCKINFPPNCIISTVQSPTIPTEPLRSKCMRAVFQLVGSAASKAHYESVDLPKLLTGEIARGPTMNCENCKKDLFDFAIVDFVKTNVTTLYENKEVILSVVCCSKYCCLTWNKNHVNETILPLDWRLV